mmetsp:Transcript_97775/g.301440  ORF Transcript_97775/g.301440 Transcript_97775/m.301440 type:complete len:235 (+) Transcript_97775:467-1171(+)
MGPQRASTAEVVRPLLQQVLLRPGRRGAPRRPPLLALEVGAGGPLRAGGAQGGRAGLPAGAAAASRPAGAAGAPVPAPGESPQAGRVRARHAGEGLGQPRAPRHGGRVHHRHAEDPEVAGGPRLAPDARPGVPGLRGDRAHLRPAPGAARAVREQRDVLVLVRPGPAGGPRGPHGGLRGRPPAGAGHRADRPGGPPPAPTVQQLLGDSLQLPVDSPRALHGRGATARVSAWYQV